MAEFIQQLLVIMITLLVPAMLFVFNWRALTIPLKGSFLKHTLGVMRIWLIVAAEITITILAFYFCDWVLTRGSELEINKTMAWLIFAGGVSSCYFCTLIAPFVKCMSSGGRWLDANT